MWKMTERSGSGRKSGGRRRRWSYIHRWTTRGRQLAILDIRDQTLTVRPKPLGKSDWQKFRCFECCHRNLTEFSSEYMSNNFYSIWSNCLSQRPFCPIQNPFTRKHCRGEHRSTVGLSSPIEWPEKGRTRPICADESKRKSDGRTVDERRRQDGEKEGTCESERSGQDELRGDGGQKQQPKRATAEDVAGVRRTPNNLNLFSYSTPQQMSGTNPRNWELPKGHRDTI